MNPRPNYTGHDSTIRHIQICTYKYDIIDDALPAGAPQDKKDARILEVVEVFAGVGAIHKASWEGMGILARSKQPGIDDGLGK